MAPVVKLVRSEMEPRAGFTAPVSAGPHAEYSLPGTQHVNGTAAASARLRVGVFGVKGLPYTGGIEQFVEDVGSRLVARGHSVTVFVRKSYNADAPSDLNGMRLEPSPGVHSKSLDAITHTVTALWRGLRKGIDVAYMHALGVAPLVVLPRLWGVPTALHLHGRDWQRAKWGPAAKLYLRASEAPAVWLPDAVASVALSDARYYSQRFHRHVRYIPNGVSIDTAPASDRLAGFGVRPGEYILFLARLVPEKGCHYLIEAFNALRPAQTLVIAGDNDHPDEYTRWLKSHANERVRFLGFVRGEDRRQLLAHCAMLAQPSDIEGLSHSILHALSYGRRVLASDIVNNVEALGGHGFLFRRGDIADLEHQLGRLLSMPEDSDPVRDGRREYVRSHYDWEAITDQIETMLVEITCRSGSAGLRPARTVAAGSRGVLAP